MGALTGFGLSAYVRSAGRVESLFGVEKSYRLMLEKSDLPDNNLSACLQEAYGLRSVRVAVLPLGANPHTRSKLKRTTQYEETFMIGVV